MSVHWSSKYVGRRFKDVEFDCVVLAETVQREVFGRNLDLPSERYYAGKALIERFRQMVLQLQEQLDLVDKYSVPTDKPEDGDGVLLRIGSKLRHIGTYCLIGGVPYILHTATSQVVLTEQRLLPTMFGITVEGYYRWK